MPTTTPGSPRPWTAPLYCHVPAGREIDLEALAEPGDETDRWNAPGERTVYLASDPGVVLAELGRQLGAGGDLASRRLLRLTPRPDGLTALVDLRDPAVLAALSLPASPIQFLDRRHARETAAGIRSTGTADGLIVPSAALLDQPQRCNVVLFAECLPRGVARTFVPPELLAEIRDAVA